MSASISFIDFLFPLQPRPFFPPSTATEKCMYLDPAFICFLSKLIALYFLSLFHFQTSMHTKSDNILIVATPKNVTTCTCTGRYGHS